MGANLGTALEVLLETLPLLEDVSIRSSICHMFCYPILGTTLYAEWKMYEILPCVVAWKCDGKIVWWVGSCMNAVPESLIEEEGCSCKTVIFSLLAVPKVQGFGLWLWASSADPSKSSWMHHWKSRIQDQGTQGGKSAILPVSFISLAYIQIQKCVTW